MGLKDEITKLSQTVMEFQNSTEREYITSEEAIAAINVLNFANYKQIPDVFLGCAAYNLLNAYTKQKDNELSCHFHRFINEIIKGIEDINKPKVIKLSFDNSEKLNLLILSFWDFQFSFQSIKYNDQIRNLETNNCLVWDGIKKQKCASTIFKYALDSKWISNETLSGNNLRAFIENEIDVFNTGGYIINNGRYIKVKELQPGTDESNKYLKNYIRNKLYSCQDRPVILSAVYRRTWEKHITFISVKPYIANTRVITICDHINLFRKDVEKVMDIKLLVPGHRYYIIGYCKPYNYSNRMGVQLAVNEEFCPIFDMLDYNKTLFYNVASRCHRFSIEEYLSVKQKELKL